MEKTIQELKYELYDLDSEYLAQVITAAEYSIKSASLMKQIKEAQTVQVTTKMWLNDTERMMACI
jgi:hypothetical protein